MDILCDAPDASCCMVQKKILLHCHLNSFHHHGSGAVALIRFAHLRTAEELSVIWLCGGRCWSSTGGCESGHTQEWNVFEIVFKSYIGVVAPPILTALDRAETLARPITVSGLSQEDAEITRESANSAGTNLVRTSSATHDARG